MNFSTEEQEWALLPKPFHFLFINHIFWPLTQVIYRICRSKDCSGYWPWQQRDGAALGLHAGARSVVQTMPLVCLPEFPVMSLSSAALGDRECCCCFLQTLMAPHQGVRLVSKTEICGFPQLILVHGRMVCWLLCR